MAYHPLTSLFSIHEALGNSIGCEDLVSVSVTKKKKSHNFGIVKTTPHIKSSRSLRCFHVNVPLSELLEDDAIGETLSANTDTLQDTIAPQLIQNQMRVEFSSLTISRILEDGRRRLTAIKFI